MSILKLSEPSLVAQPGPTIRITGLTKVFGRRGQETTALSEVSISVKEQEFLCIVGRSGCGKSTMLNIIADLETPTGGSVDVGGRKVGMMFQDANLFPWLTVEGNIDLALKLSGVAAELRKDRIQELLETVQLAHVATKRPHELSGGMRQRVALARTLAQDCEILLMDEPFAALDEMTRQRLDDQLRELWLRLGLTVMFVTHSVDEAAYLAERALVFSSRPARIVADIQLELPRLRTVALRAEASFAKEARALRVALEKGGG